LILIQSEEQKYQSAENRYYEMMKNLAAKEEYISIL
jgi:hypothetical protein